ncbi:hypothetical protein [Streptomyces tendae]
MRACSTAVRTDSAVRVGSTTIRAASSSAAVEAGPVIEAAIFWDAVRTAPA